MRKEVTIMDEADVRAATTRLIEKAVEADDLQAAHDAVAELSVEQVVDVLERLGRTDRAVLYR